MCNLACVTLQYAFGMNKVLPSLVRTPRSLYGSICIGCIVSLHLPSNCSCLCECVVNRSCLYVWSKQCLLVCWYLEECNRDVDVLWDRPHHHAPVRVFDPRLPTMQLQNKQHGETVSHDFYFGKYSNSEKDLHLKCNLSNNLGNNIFKALHMCIVSPGNSGDHFKPHLSPSSLIYNIICC